MKTVIFSILLLLCIGTAKGQSSEVEEAIFRLEHGEAHERAVDSMLTKYVTLGAKSWLNGERVKSLIEITTENILEDLELFEKYDDQKLPRAQLHNNILYYKAVCFTLKEMFFEGSDEFDVQLDDCIEDCNATLKVMRKLEPNLMILPTSLIN